MKMFKLFLFSAIIALSSCNSPVASESKAKETVDAVSVKLNGFKADIKAMEKRVQEDVSLDMALAFNLTDTYSKYAKLAPKDTLSPVYLSRCADILKELPGKGLQAVNMYNRVFALYPDHELASRAVFMMAFVFDEKYHDAERAIKSYDFFLKQYPDHPLAGDAKNLRALLEVSEGDDLKQIKEWKKNAEKEKN